MALGAALGVSMATTSAALADCGWLSACTVTNELCVVTYTHNHVVVSTFHDDNIRETRISMLCASCFGTHYRKLFSVVTLLQFLSLC